MGWESLHITVELAVVFEGPLFTVRVVSKVISLRSHRLRQTHYLGTLLSYSELSSLPDCIINRAERKEDGSPYQPNLHLLEDLSSFSNS